MSNNGNENNARHIAVRILTRVEKDGSYANLLLRDMLSDMSDARERHLASALVNGVLKNRLLLDYALRIHLSKAMSALPHEIRAILRVGAFQILFFDKIPASAAVNESVNMVKIWFPKSRSNYAGLVNSVLRRTADTGWKFSWPDRNKESLRYLSVRYSHPEWIVSRWLQRWGAEETENLLTVNNEPAPTTIRLNTLKTNKEEFVTALEKCNLSALPGSRLPETFFLEDFGDVEKVDLFRNGLFTVQDESSQLVAHVLGARPGDQVLDVCSAPGGKTTHIAQLMNNQGRIVAVDIFPHKLVLVEELARRLGIDIIQTVEADAAKLEATVGRFNRVLVDAPCSGLGVIRRRADLRWHKKEEEMAEFPKLQLDILLKASEFVLPGGEIVYSTCTTEPEENFEVIKAFRRLRPEFKAVDILPSLPFTVAEERDIRQLQKGFWQILPHLHHMDGFFLAKLRLSE